MSDNVKVAHSFTPYKCFINPSFTFPCIHNAIVPPFVTISKLYILVGGGDAIFIKNSNDRYHARTIASLGGCCYMVSYANIFKQYVCGSWTHIRCAFQYWFVNSVSLLFIAGYTYDLSYYVYQQCKDILLIWLYLVF